MACGSFAVLGTTGGVGGVQGTAGREGDAHGAADRVGRAGSGAQSGPAAVLEWEVLLKDHHDGYIDCAEFERNQKQLAVNAYGKLGKLRVGDESYLLRSGSRESPAGQPLSTLRCVRTSLMLPAGEIPAPERGTSHPTGNLAKPNLDTL
jgi:hypothetical protein